MQPAGMSGDEIGLPALGLVSWGRRGDRAGQPDQLLCKHDDSTLDAPITLAQMNRGSGVPASESREWSCRTDRASTRGARPVVPRATSRMGESGLGSPRRPGYRCLRLCRPSGPHMRSDFVVDQDADVSVQARRDGGRSGERHHQVGASV